VITVSIGTLTITVNNDNVNMNMVDAADKAMKQAKGFGRDQTFTFPNVVAPQILHLKMN
jgi:PleD family two-component response regulator